MLRRKNLTIFILMLFSSLLLQAQTKRALVIGIGQYPSYTGWARINGDNDVKYVKNYLENARFSSIRTLVNKDATKSNIVAAFNKLKADSKSGDIIYVHFSGHGQQMKDVNKDESDELDECWIPYDACRQPCKMDKGEKHLTDDEIYFLLTGIRNKVGAKGKILVVVDACHSGGSTSSRALATSDAVGGETVRGVWDIFETMLKSPKKQAGTYQKQEKNSSEQWITLSACQSDEMNTEMRSPSVGKLTYGISKIVNNGKPHTNSEFYQLLSHFMNKCSTTFPQTPDLTGLTNRYNITEILR